MFKNIKKLQFNVIELSIIGCSVYLIGISWGWPFADYLRSKESILAIHGSLLAGLLAVIAAYTSISQVRRQIREEKIGNEKNCLREGRIFLLKIKRQCKIIHSCIEAIDNALCKKPPRLAMEYKNLMQRNSISSIVHDPNVLSRMGHEHTESFLKIIEQCISLDHKLDILYEIMDVALNKKVVINRNTITSDSINYILDLNTDILDAIENLENQISSK